jgi:peptide deformylase
MCSDISPDYPEFDTILANMWETMYEANGVGLAAPQVNKRIRLFLIDTTPFFDDEEEIKEVIVKQAFINARILEESGEDWEFNEGCLSIPDLREDVIRKSTITIEYMDENFEKHTATYDGLTARVIQHEYDHINGILFTDKLTALRKRMIKGKLMDISKGKVNANYKMRFTR